MFFKVCNEKIKMDSFCCEIPLDIKYHYRQSVAYKNVEVIEKSFCNQLTGVHKKLKPGMKLCLKCKNKLKAYTDSPKCADPFSLGPHSSNNFRVITEDIKNLFNFITAELPVGSTLCQKCLTQLENQLVNMEGQIDSNLCCNPFNKLNHAIGKQFRFVTQKLISGNSDISIQLNLGTKICNKCRLQLHKSNKKIQNVKIKSVSRCLR